MRADNRGEGGIFALTVLALARRRRAARPMDPRGRAFRAGAVFWRRRADPVDLGAERGRGAQGRDPALEPYVLPLTLVLLIALFLLQRRGTGRVGGLFGPIIIVWFATIGLLGLVEITRNPAILKALNPLYAIDLIAADPAAGLCAARLGRPGGDRRRGALCRYGAFRPGADPPRLAALCVSGLAAELFRAGRAAARQPGGGARTRSSVSRRTGRSTRWSGSPRPPRSSPRRRSSPAPSR